MKEHKMKKSFCLSTAERYKAAGYPKASIECLHYLESRCEKLGEFLEEFRHIQPDNRLFTPESIGLIKELHSLVEWLGDVSSAVHEIQTKLLTQEEVNSFISCQIDEEI